MPKKIELYVQSFILILIQFQILDVESLMMTVTHGKVPSRVSVQGVKSLGSHFACLCRGFQFYEVRKKNYVLIFQKENGNTFTLLIIFIVKSHLKKAK